MKIAALRRCHAATTFVAAAAAFVWHCACVTCMPCNAELETFSGIFIYFKDSSFFVHKSARVYIITLSHTYIHAYISLMNIFMHVHKHIDGCIDEKNVKRFVALQMLTTHLYSSPLHAPLLLYTFGSAICRVLVCLIVYAVLIYSFSWHFKDVSISLCGQCCRFSTLSPPPPPTATID